MRRDCLVDDMRAAGSTCATHLQLLGLLHHAQIDRLRDFLRAEADRRFGAPEAGIPLKWPLKLAFALLSCASCVSTLCTQRLCGV